MAQAKLPIKDVLAAIDMGAKSVWDELNEEERKSVGFWLLNRYVSSVKGNREKQELAIFKTNEFYNKNWNELGMKHPKLQWQLICQSGNTGKIEFHPWIGFKKKNGDNSKGIKLLKQIYPNMKEDEIELLANLSTKKELKQLAEEHDIEIKL
jgi:hypothetical protein|tara:strand:- start:7986 stop:8441 length:456 start_codon:yes stop_codon:yes gene_type:complete